MNEPHFFDLYELYAESETFTGSFVKEQEGKKCRFCEKSYPKVTFKTIPHLVPELLGRNNMTSNFECDECNRLFQKFESDTSTFLQHNLSLLGLKTKNNVPVFQSPKGEGGHSTVLRTDGNERKIYFGANKGDFEFDDKKNMLTVNFRTKNFRPFSLYKVFLKMGISLLNTEDFEANKHYLEFLFAEEPINNGMQHYSLYRQRLNSKYFPQPKVTLFKAKKTLIDGVVYPEYSMNVAVANIVYQLFLPVSKKNMDEYIPGNELRISVYPTFVLDGWENLTKVEIRHMDLSETSKVSITDTIDLFYTDRIRNRSNSGDNS